MKDQRAFEKRGRTGREGTSLKFWGTLALAGGLIWMILAYAMSEGLSAIIAPVCLLLAGSGVFFAGRSVARSSASGRGSASPS